MFIYLYIIVTFLLPLLFLLLLTRVRKFFSYHWYISFAAFLLVTLFTWQAGAWPYTGFIWRYYFFLVYAVTWILILFRNQRKQKPTHTKNITAGSILQTIAVLILIAFNLEFYNGNKSHADSIELSFPLQHGNYVFMQGGNTEIGNVAHRTHTKGSMAMDITKLNSHGRRGTKLFSKNVHDYTIYGDTIVSPCDCTVAGVFNGRPENIPPDNDPDHRCGNYVLLAQGDLKILICHMQLNSIMVQTGQTIKSGTPIGLVGNSGYSIEPHLHIQAYRSGSDGNIQVPISFDGKIYKMNDEIHVK